MAQYESELIGERVKNNIRYKKANNLHIGKAPYGYKLENNKLIKKEDEYAVIEFITNNLLKKRSQFELTNELYKLLNKLNKDQSYFVPIEFILEDDEYEYEFPVDKNSLILTITTDMIVNILNDYEIQKNNKPWTHSSIRYINKNTSMYSFQTMSL